MEIGKLVLGSYKTNCYVISHNDQAIVIDPGANGEIVEALLKRNNLKLESVFLTHGHFDHIGGVDYLYNLHHMPIYAHICEKDLIEGNIENQNDFKTIKVNAPIQYFEGDFNNFNVLQDISFDAIHTPGHSAGSVVYVLRSYSRVFSGDTLFKEGIGRIDFPTSNKKAMKESLKLLSTFKDSCKVFPGHGEITTIGYEKENNMYF